MKHLSTLYQDNLKEALERLGEAAIQATRDGHTILVLDDSELIDNDDESKVKEQRYAMPMLLAISHIHQLLIREGLRMDTSLVALSGETREVLLEMVILY